MRWPIGTIRALALATSLLAAGAASAESPVAPPHAPCTSLDLWGDLQAVISTCEALIKSGKLQGADLAEALRHQGDAYFRSFHVRFAYNNYQHALQLKPDWPQALWNLGNASAVLGYGDLAMKSERRAVEVDPTYSKPHAALGTFLSNTGDPEGALKEFDRALELDPKDYLARFNRALTRDRVGRKLDALHDLDALLADDETEVNRTYFFMTRKPDEDFVGTIYRSRAIIFQHVGSFDEALASLKSALDRRPGYANAAIFRSQLIRGVSGYKSRYGEALASLDRAMELHPDSPEMPALAMEKAILLVRMDRQQDARAVLADSTRFESPGDGDFLIDRSHAWESLKEFDRAQADFVQAMSTDQWSFQAALQSMQGSGYLMSWPGLDPQVALTNAVTACVHDSLC